MSTEDKKINGLTIGDLSPAPKPITGKELIEIEQDGQSFNCELKDVIPAGPQGDDAITAWFNLPGNENKTIADYENAIRGKDGKDGTDGEDGKSALDVAKENDPAITDWESYKASISGKDGKDGEDGAPGPSILETAIENDPEVTDWESFKQSIKGESGKDGENGENGKDGETAYQIAKRLDPTIGTEEEWTQSLYADAPAFFGPVEELPDPVDVPPNHVYFKRNEEGKAHSFTVRNGEWIDHGDFSGPNGLSAFELAIQAGFIGTEEEWRESLRGIDGIGLRILGSLPSIEFLPTEGMESGDAYIIAEKMWVWDTETFSPVGQVGPTGKSAYQHAQDNGFEGTLTEWLASLKGEKGNTGDDAITAWFKQPGNGGKTLQDYEDAIRGKTGPEGKSALAVAMENDPAITNYDDWREDLKGDPAQVINILGVVESLDQMPRPGVANSGYVFEGYVYGWIEDDYIRLGTFGGPRGLQGPEGKNAYELWKAQEGNTDKTFEEFQEAFRGKTGQSVYEQWVAQPDNVGKSFEDFLLSQKGENGKDGADGADGTDGVDGAPGLGFIPDVVVASLDEIAEPTEGLKARVGENAHIYRNGTWDNLGRWSGPAGKNGESAYEIAKRLNPSIGTEAEWEASLKGEDGKDGTNGTDGTDGVDGKDFIPDIVVASFEDLPETAEEKTLARAGDNAYVFRDSAWVDLGAWGLKGDRGQEGKSALEVAQESDPSIVDWETFQAAIRGETGPGFLEDWLARPENEGKTQTDFDAFYTGKDGKDGEDGLSFIPDLTFESEVDLPSEAEEGTKAVAGTNAYIVEGGTWRDLGRWVGPEGKRGEVGPSFLADLMERNPGKTEEEVLAMFNGKDGEDGLDGKDGDDSITAWLALPGNEDKTVDDYVEAFRGIQGVEGPEGPMGPALNVTGEFLSPDDLPETGTLGEAYLIDGNYWFWSEALQAFKDGGKVQGPEGKRGIQGEEGPRGKDGKTALEVVMENDPTITNYNQWQAKLKGEKGDRGNYWYVEDRDPNPVDGVPGDFFLNKSSLEYFRKMTQVLWAPMGHMGGGNVHMPTRNTRMQGIRDGVWDFVPFDKIETDGEYVGTKEGWKRFDTYTTFAGSEYYASNSLDISKQQTFHLDMSVNRAMTIPDLPGTDRSAVVVLFLHGSAGALSFTGTNVNWGDAGIPEPGKDFTVITLAWDNLRKIWFAGGGSSGTIA